MLFRALISVSRLTRAGVLSVWQDNYTALHLAVQAGKATVVETLLGHGAQVEIRGTQVSSRERQGS